MLKPEYTTKFQKDLKIIQKRNGNLELLKDIIRQLCNEQQLPAKIEFITYQAIGLVAKNAIYSPIGY